MIDLIFKSFNPLQKATELYISNKQIKKQERLDVLETLSKASMETRKAFIEIKNGKELPVEKQYEIAELWRKSFVIVSKEHPETAYMLMGKSNSWLTPEFWKKNDEEMKKIESNLEAVDRLILNID